ncbi:TnsA-like heteromeric transposase endonuclease subunit [Cryobacterium sp. BB307]|uniref:TnsA-like heteromeric transposase endonuclease subunit n=1 Tax=Cryobacterium sp. BB307 TaxID=2716317 RepID=UPI00144732B4|nr:TnsA-like heteromeric transposase endonuclease subunit [Cryobacterium sp. BB307]
MEIRARSTSFNGFAEVCWLEPSGSWRREPATPQLLDRELYLASASREGNRYAKQRNYHGFYYFTGTGTHVRTESLLEASCLAWLDLTCDIVAIASQPMRIDFADGTRHFPDLFALHSNHRQVLYDVKPTARIDARALTQFARTMALCERVGWGYEILTELPPVEHRNVAYLRHFKHRGFHPAPQAVDRLLASLSEPMPFDDAARTLALGTLADSRAALLHLVWRRVVAVDLSTRLSSTSLVERSNRAHA